MRSKCLHLKLINITQGVLIFQYINVNLYPEFFSQPNWNPAGKKANFGFTDRIEYFFLILYSFVCTQKHVTIHLCFFWSCSQTRCIIYYIFISFFQFHFRANRANIYAVMEICQPATNFLFDRVEKWMLLLHTYINDRYNPADKEKPNFRLAS